MGGTGASPGQFADHRPDRAQLITRNNAVAETTIGLYKTECVREGSPFRNGPLSSLADLEDITSAWVHWYNTARLMHRLGRRPPAEVEAEYYARLHAAERTGHR
jgi:putative transposase